MAVIGFANQKGGCGKSTTSIHFAYWLTHKKNRSVVVVDADAQKSSSVWMGGMEHRIESIAMNDPDSLLEQIPDLETKYDFVVIDGPAGLVESTRAILFRTTLAVIPCQPTGVDLRSASDTVRLIKQAQSVRGGLPKAAVFLNRAVKGTKLKTEAIEVLSQIPTVTSLNAIIHQRQIIADTSGQSCTVWELGSPAAQEAAVEYEGLFEEILSCVN